MPTVEWNKRWGQQITEHVEANDTFWWGYQWGDPHKRPILSASPPAMTMKMPENRAVMLTAILFRLSLIPSSSRIVGATFSVVCAKSQKVMTARTIPTISLLAVRCVSAIAAAAVETKTRTSLS